MIYNHNTSTLLSAIRGTMAFEKIKMSELSKRMNCSGSALSGVFSQDNITLEKLNEICDALDYKLEIKISHNGKDDTII